MKKIFISGIFNVLHPGHQRLFEFAKMYGDQLIVGLLSTNIINENNIYSDNLRLQALRNFNQIDKIILIKNNVNDEILKIKPSYIVKGKEFENKYNEEEKILNKIKAELIFSPGNSKFNENFTEKNSNGSTNHSSYNVPRDFIKRKNINSSKVIKIINKFKKLKICVIGDIIIDEYISCEPLGISQEEPCIVVRPFKKNKFLGGAGIVSAHCASLGGEVDFISVVGNDENKKFAKIKLKEYSINSYLINDKMRQTNLKTRYKADNKSLLRTNIINNIPISQAIQNKILNYFRRNAKKYDLLIFSDFNYGCLPQALVKKLIALAKLNSIYISADSQSSSQKSDISRYNQVDLITPTELEARISTKLFNDGLNTVYQKLYELSHVNNIILKLGKEGLIINHQNLKQKWAIEKLKPISKNAVDISGAGDSLLATSSMAMKINNNIFEAAFLGQIAAAIQISRVGNIPIKINELKKMIKKIL